MQRKFLKYFLIYFFAATFCLISSCSSVKVKEPYMISNFKNIQDLERQDHKFCMSLNLDSAKGFDLKNAVYWRCRLSLAKYKLGASYNAQDGAKYNFQINDLVSKISLNLSDISESEFIKELRKMGDHHHRQCVRMGFNPDTLDQIVIDDYFLCRKRLIEDQELDPPFGNIDYLEHPNRTYNIGFVISERLAKEDKKLKEAAAKYPTCTKYNLRKENFKTCSKAQDKSRQCFTEINKKKLKKEAVEKTICQKQSYVEFPNSFLSEEDVKMADINEVKNNADIYNQNSFGSLGINKEDVKKFQSDIKKNEKSEKKKIEKNINSKNGLYSKTDLTRLRQRYIYACHKEVDIGIDLYAEELKKECGEMVKFEEVME